MAASNDALHQLKWIDAPAGEPPTETSPRVSEGSRTPKTLVQKLAGNLLVPFSLLATVYCLTMGMTSMRRNDVKRQQLFMRGRVGFQGLALAAMVYEILKHDYTKQAKKTSESNNVNNIAR